MLFSFSCRKNFNSPTFVASLSYINTHCNAFELVWHGLEPRAVLLHVPHKLLHQVTSTAFSIRADSGNCVCAVQIIICYHYCLPQLFHHSSKAVMHYCLVSVHMIHEQRRPITQTSSWLKIKHVLLQLQEISYCKNCQSQMLAWPVTTGRSSCMNTCVYI